MKRQTVLAPLPGEGSKGQISFFISIKKSVSNVLKPNCAYVLTNERYKTYQTGFLFCRLGHAPGVGLWGAGVARGIMLFSNMVMWHVKLTGMTSRTERK